MLEILYNLYRSVYSIIESVVVGHQSGHDINQIGLDGNAPIHRAAQSGDLLSVSTLVSSGANINLCNEEGCTPLQCAAVEGNIQVVNYFITSGADLDFRTSWGVTALMLANYGGNVDVIKRLVRAGASLDIKDSLGCTAFTNAVRSDSLEAVEVFAKLGANIHDVDQYGGTILMNAIRPEEFDDGRFSDIKTDVLRYLISVGADVNAVDYLGGSALTSAMNFQLTDVVHLLLSSGAIDQEHVDLDTVVTPDDVTLNQGLNCLIGSCRFLLSKATHPGEQDWLVFDSIKFRRIFLGTQNILDDLLDFDVKQTPNLLDDLVVVIRMIPVVVEFRADENLSDFFLWDALTNVADRMVDIVGVLVNDQRRLLNGFPHMQFMLTASLKVLVSLYDQHCSDNQKTVNVWFEDVYHIRLLPMLAFLIKRFACGQSPVERQALKSLINQCRQSRLDITALIVTSSLKLAAAMLIVSSMRGISDIGADQVSALLDNLSSFSRLMIVVSNLDYVLNDQPLPALRLSELNINSESSSEEEWRMSAPGPSLS